MISKKKFVDVTSEVTSNNFFRRYPTDQSLQDIWQLLSRLILSLTEFRRISRSAAHVFLYCISSPLISNLPAQFFKDLFIYYRICCSMLSTTHGHLKLDEYFWLLCPLTLFSNLHSFSSCRCSIVLLFDFCS